ncbi:MAG: hypothetical protein QGG19_08220 [Alphaproteobacteria bacterium]|jgi:hypothetical protein|nr:hypothetical protein [Alphaproteobacteria bacterium]MDP6253565.1 hypothetical protein [Alphaproteobacteria bacterium]MDP7054021.1 hypothetical protein [Alphaproteobacteria bacterium]MDP7227332.1 hypothetical protein [Alphaproteobacteria bacterium]MDP7461275.1 hypothetical protein [Alphaproteobacteria bacterium]
MARMAAKVVFTTGGGFGRLRTAQGPGPRTLEGKARAGGMDIPNWPRRTAISAGS